MFTSGRKDQLFWGENKNKFCLCVRLQQLFHLSFLSHTEYVTKTFSSLSFSSVYILLYSTSFVALDCHGEFQHGPCGWKKKKITFQHRKRKTTFPAPSHLILSRQASGKPYVFRPPRLLSYSYRQVARRDSLAKITMWRWAQESCKYQIFTGLMEVVGLSWWLQTAEQVVAAWNISIAWEVNSIF